MLNASATLLTVHHERELGAHEVVHWAFPCCSEGYGEWMARLGDVRRLVA